MNRIIVSSVFCFLFLFQNSVQASTVSLEHTTSKAGFPNININAAQSRVNGEAAVTALGDDIKAVATWHRKTPNDLALLIRNDKALWVDKAGRLFYEEASPLLLDGLPAYSPPRESTASSIPSDRAFLLHSKPSSKHVIYLNFLGMTLAKDNMWSLSYNGGKELSAPPFDIDGNPSSYSAKERSSIIEVWQRISEDYAPFDVDITTEAPISSRLDRTSWTDEYYGMTALFTPLGKKLGTPAGGVAAVGIFSMPGFDVSKPVLLFTDNLANSAKFMAEAGSHEVGHTLSLYHDGTRVGTKTTAYYLGHGEWAPIMGAGYYKEVSEWSRGEYPLASMTQDDLAEIERHVGIANDDNGGAPTSATELVGPGVSVQGIIEKNTDVDVFKFTMSDGLVTLTLSTAPFGPNLNAKVELRNTSGTILHSSVTHTTTSVSKTLSAGTYYVFVSGTGSGTLATGYSNYGSIGQYTISGTIPKSVTVPIPNVIPTVTLTSPLHGSSFRLPVSIPLTAHAGDVDGSIQRVDFYQGTTLLGSDTVAPYVYTWTGAASSTYVLKAVAYDNMSAMNTSSAVTISVLPPFVPPIPIARVAPITGVSPLSVTFDGSRSTDLDGSIVSYVWRYEDGTTVGAMSPTRRLIKAGTYTGTLTVVDDSGISRVSTPVSVVVINTPPVALSKLDKTTGVVPLSVKMSGSGSTDLDGMIARYDWDFGDGTRATGINVEHTYSTTGNSIITLTVTDTMGATGVVTTSVAVTPPPKVTKKPVAGFTFALSGSTVRFDARSSTPGDVALIKYEWDFGNGTKLTSGPYLQGVQFRPGVYVVTLTITDANKDTSKASRVVVVAEPAKVSAVAVLTPSEIWNVLRSLWSR